MPDEAKLEQTELGEFPRDEGWFVMNARSTRWWHAEGRSALCDFEGVHPFEQYGINVNVLEPGQALGMYHWEADQEDFLVISGRAVLLIEGQERELGPWDLVHCPPETSHSIIGAGDTPTVVIAIGARQRSTGPLWGAYPVDELASSHGVGVVRETTEAAEAYAGQHRRRPAAYRQGWLPDMAV